MPRLLLHLFLLTVWAAPLVAQRGPDALPQRPLAQQPAPLLRDWLATQQTAARQLDTVTVTERARWDVDGPFGARRWERVVRWRRQPGADDWTREELAPVVLPPPARGAASRSPLRRLEPLLDALLFPARLIDRLVPAGPVLAVERDGQPTRRLDLLPPEGSKDRAALRRLTLWFDLEGRLVASRTLVTAPRGGSMVVDTRFRRWRGLDVPVLREAEGLLETRRRRRSFTLLVQHRSHFDAYATQGSE